MSKISAWSERLKTAAAVSVCLSVCRHRRDILYLSSTKLKERERESLHCKCQEYLPGWLPVSSSSNAHSLPQLQTIHLSIHRKEWRRRRRRRLWGTESHAAKFLVSTLLALLAHLVRVLISTATPKKTAGKQTKKKKKSLITEDSGECLSGVCIHFTC